MRQSAKATVKAKHPDAKAERQKTNGGKVYWLIRFGRSFMPYADGDTESKAWKQAADRLRMKERLAEEMSK